MSKNRRLTSTFFPMRLPDTIKIFFLHIEKKTLDRRADACHRIPRHMRPKNTTNQWTSNLFFHFLVADSRLYKRLYFVVIFLFILSVCRSVGASIRQSVDSSVYPSVGPKRISKKVTFKMAFVSVCGCRWGCRGGLYHFYDPALPTIVSRYLFMCVSVRVLTCGWVP